MKNVFRRFSCALLTFSLLFPIASATVKKSVSASSLAGTSVAINSTNFPNAAFRSLVSQYDTDNSGSLSEKERNQVTSIDADNKGITSFKGIEHFPSLKYFYCQSNGLTSLDVSKNTNLIWFLCGNNNLTSINTSNNPNLICFSCYGNQISKLDLSRNTALLFLTCSNNKLTSLNLSQNTALKSLNCYGNSLSSLDISKCPNLVRLIRDNKMYSYTIDQTIYVYEGDYGVDDGELRTMEIDPSTKLNPAPGTAPVIGLKAVSAGKNRVRLSWTKDVNADGYLIYGQKNGKYAYVGMASSNSFTDAKALSGDYNYYWVFSYIKSSNGKMITGSCARYAYAKGVCPAVTNLKANGTTGKVTLTWNASSGAEGYLIYGIRPGGKYSYVGMTSGRSFVDSKASKTSWTYYWVFPYHKEGSKMVVGGTAKYVYSKAR